MTALIKQIWYNEKSRNTAFQVALLLTILAFIYFLAHNLQKNLDARGIASGFGFLEHRAGFSIVMHLIDFSEQATYGQAFIVGLLNTIVVSAISIFIATFIGVVVGVARLSPNWLWSKIAFVYVEIIRNVPLLLQIFFWYFVVLRAAPYPQDSLQIGDTLFLNNRGLYLPKPIITPIAGMMFTLSAIGVLLGLSLKKMKYNKQIVGVYAVSLVTVLIGILLCEWDLPRFGRFNFEHGFNIIPEFMALACALSTYTASFIAEIIRMGILAVPKGQWEAARSLGMNRKQVLRLVIMPQALKIIIPPLTNQYLNLAKNSSLAAAIAYPDLVAVFAGTVLNQTGQAVEIIAITMAVYLTISVSISLFMLWHERRTRWGKRM